MKCLNETTPTEFVLYGFPFPQEMQVPLLVFFFIMYFLTLSGNSLIIWVVVSDLQLHKPMYWFLCHLSIMDIAFSTVVVPRVIAGFIPGGRIIYFGECVSQVFSLQFLGCSESLLYTVMAYDRFLAICKPLHYPNIMNLRACSILSLCTVILGCLNSTLQTTFTFHLPFGQRNHLDYIFCDIPALLKLSCADTTVNEFVILVGIGSVAMSCFLLILTSYMYIISAILRISTREGRRRAFSTCTSHVTVVVIFYVPVLFHYLRPTSQDSIDSAVSMFYTTITPFLNPVIYTLRNKEMKANLKKRWDVNQNKQHVIV